MERRYSEVINVPFSSRLWLFRGIIQSIKRVLLEILKSKNSKIAMLCLWVFAESSEIYASISVDCSIVYDDSLNDEIFVEEFRNEWNSHYYKVEIIDVSKSKVTDALAKRTISKKEFDSHVEKANMVLQKL